MSRLLANVYRIWAMSEKQAIVTIDGPSGVGKSTISRRLAALLGYTYLDTGAMYRAVALGCQQHGVDTGDTRAVAAVLQGLSITLQPPVEQDADVCVLLNGNDVSAAIRTPEMGMLASRVSALPPVRQHLTALQQQMGKKGNLVAEGRDTGTVVFPDAAWKFYLDASPEQRTIRRAGQLQEQGKEIDQQELLQQIKARDKADSQRSIAPLTRAKDTVYIDSSHIDADAVVEQMLSCIRGR